MCKIKKIDIYLCIYYLFKKHSNITNPSRNQKSSKMSFKTLITDLLGYYIEKSSNSNEPYKYAVNRTSDDNLILFEKLSINNQIGIYTNLSAFDTKIVLLILEAVYSKNYGMFEKDFMQDILYDNDITNEEFGIDEMLNEFKNNKINVEKWVEYLNLLPLYYEDEEEDEEEIKSYIDEYGSNIYLLQIYEKLPYIECHFNLKKHEQKFYLLNEIIDLC